MENLKWVEIFLWYTCNLKCKFCFQKDLRYKKSNFLEKEKVISIIDKSFSEWKKSIIFSWWEVTLDKNILEYISYSKNKWFKDIRVHTNWILFSDINILRKYVEKGMNAIIISIHWYGKVHDYLVSSNWAFNKVKKTFLNLLELKKEKFNITIDTNTVLNKFNYKNLDVLFKFLSYFPITRSQIVQLYSLYLFTFEEKKKLYISYNDFAPYIWSILKNNINITLENFPLCKVDKKYWDYILNRQKYNNDAYWNMWEWFEESDCIYLKGCNNCKYKNLCTWIPKDYLKIFINEKFIL
jgi:MoaA/NifB/PqqE/SkfB family radical SAM enzyme